MRGRSVVEAVEAIKLSRTDEPDALAAAEVADETEQRGRRRSRRPQIMSVEQLRSLLTVPRRKGRMGDLVAQRYPRPMPEQHENQQHQRESPEQEGAAQARVVPRRPLLLKAGVKTINPAIERGFGPSDSARDADDVGEASSLPSMPVFRDGQQQPPTSSATVNVSALTQLLRARTLRAHGT